MGNVCKAMKVTNQKLHDGHDFETSAPHMGESGAQIHMLICCLDYKKTENPLTCSYDAKNMKALCEMVTHVNLKVMMDEECQVDAVKQAIHEVGSRCKAGDYFIFYYTGHGTNIEDMSGDEADGEDEAFCFVDADGQVGRDTCFIDDDFAAAVCAAVDEEAQVLVLTDCCHSGSIADLEKDCWAGRKAVSIAGCLDNQTSGDIGVGGIMTHSMLLAIEQLSNDGDDDYSVARLYNETLDKDNTVFDSKQDITVHSTPGFDPSNMAWPLVPAQPYTAPLSEERP